MSFCLFFKLCFNVAIYLVAGWFESWLKTLKDFKKNPYGKNECANCSRNQWSWKSGWALLQSIAKIIVSPTLPICPFGQTKGQSKWYSVNSPPVGQRLRAGHGVGDDGGVLHWSVCELLPCWRKENLLSTRRPGLLQGQDRRKTGLAPKKWGTSPAEGQKSTNSRAHVMQYSWILQSSRIWSPTSNQQHTDSVTSCYLIAVSVKTP